LQICFVPFSGPWTTPPGISWAYGEICVLLTHLLYLYSPERQQQQVKEAPNTQVALKST